MTTLSNLWTKHTDALIKMLVWFIIFQTIQNGVVNVKNRQSALTLENDYQMMLVLAKEIACKYGYILTDEKTIIGKEKS